MTSAFECILYILIPLGRWEILTLNYLSIASDICNFNGLDNSCGCYNASKLSAACTASNPELHFGHDFHKSGNSELAWLAFLSWHTSPLFAIQGL